MNRILALVVVIGSVSIAAAGCGGKSTADYVPRADAARQAVETVLETWKSGAAYAPITSTKPAINVFEARWQAGKKLERYEIVEEVAGQEHPQLKVRIQLSGQAEETETYRVVGIDPLNVFREADYQRAIGM